MKLFYKYYSRKLQFAADVFALLDGSRGMTVSEASLQRLAWRYGMDPMLTGQVLNSLEQAELIIAEKEKGYKRYRKNYDWAADVPPIPTSVTEEQYLQMILRLPQAKLFLPALLREKLTQNTEPIQNKIQLFLNHACDPLPKLPPEQFRCILEAISRSCAISYVYRTFADDTEHRASCFPWRIEFSAFDFRWWLILYVRDEQRCVKAWLNKLSDIRLEPQLTVRESEILSARKKLRMPEPVVLRVKDEKGALERCFFAMDRQEFESSQLLEDGSCIVSFSYQRYQERDILLELMMLGPGVTLQKPAYLRRQLLQMVRQGLDNLDPPDSTQLAQETHPL